MPGIRRPGGSVAAALVAALLAASIAACGSGEIGLASPPASFDPASPTLSASNVEFETDSLAVPAGRPFVLVFENRDSVEHNVSIYADASLQQRRFQGVLFSGPSTRWYPVAALAAGTYVFVCDLHPNMRGLLQAG